MLLLSSQALFGFVALHLGHDALACCDKPASA